MQYVIYLGYPVDEAVICLLPSKIETIKKFPKPNSLWKLRDFLGLIKYYRRLIPHCTESLFPLTEILKNRKNKKNWPISLNDKELLAFHGLKENLCEAALLNHPALEAKISLEIDASDVWIGGVLQRFHHDSWQPLGFFTNKLMIRETRYNVFGKDLLAVYLSIKYFRHHLNGRSFTLWTNYKPFIHALK